jgi:D-amino-acid dehydrogenase
MAQRNARDVIVIGGGIAGSSAAYALARAGAGVTLVDRADAGQATAAGAGIIAPGTNASLPDAFYTLAYRAVAYYEELMASLAADGETHTGYGVVGMLHIATSGVEAARLSDVERLLRERQAAGLATIGDVARLDSAEARALFPALGPVEGAIHASGAARVDGRLLRDALRRAAERHGVRVLVGSVALTAAGDAQVRVSLDGQAVEAGAVILAGGAWSRTLAEALGVQLPVYPQRGQILHLALPGADTSRWPVVLGFHSHYLLTFPPDRVVAGATREDAAGFDARLTAGGAHEVLGEALRVAPGLAGATLHELRVGLRPASPDSLPMLGPLPGYPNVFALTGFGANGLQLGPYSGKLIADLILGRPAAFDLTRYAPDRFE